MDVGGTEKSWAELEQEAGLVSGPQRKDLSSGFPTMQCSNQPTQLQRLVRLSVKALAGPCRTEPTIVTGVGLRRITIFGTGFYNLISEVIAIKTFKINAIFTHTDSLLNKDRFAN